MRVLALPSEAMWKNQPVSRLKRAIKVLEIENRDNFVVMMLTIVIDM